MKGIKKGPFEVYWNEHTEKYHAIHYTGRTRNGGRTCDVLGKFDTYEEAEEAMFYRIGEVLADE